MRGAPKKYDLDLSQMADEALAVLAQECGFRPAADELVLRYYDRMNGLLAHKARGLRLTAADLQDAQQNAVFAILEAIAGYNTREMVKPRGCSFRTYLGLVVTARFRDFVKHVRRTEKRYRRAEEGGDSEDGHAGAGRRLHRGRANDPAEAAAEREALAHLHEALGRLDEAKRELWQELAAGKKLPQIAREWGVSYDAVKRQRQRLLAQLTVQLRGLRQG